MCYCQGRDPDILLFDLSTGDLVSRLQSHTDAVNSLSFSRDGNVLASGWLKVHFKGLYKSRAC